MKLTKNTTPQARNYQCDRCLGIKSHKNMFDNDICELCYDEVKKGDVAC